jgi:hypothetical protein
LFFFKFNKNKTHLTILLSLYRVTIRNVDFFTAKNFYSLDERPSWGKNGYANAPQCYIYTYIACLVNLVTDKILLERCEEMAIAWRGTARRQIRTVCGYFELSLFVSACYLAGGIIT